MIWKKRIRFVNRTKVYTATQDFFYINILDSDILDKVIEESQKRMCLKLCWSARKLKIIIDPTIGKCFDSS